MKKVQIFADGSCIGNPGAGGWCAILRYKDKEKIISGGEPNTTNNKMELTAVIKALEALKMPCEVDLYTDSKYVVEGLKSWLDNWAKNNWKNSKKEKIANLELWQRLYQLKNIHKINPIWVKGHSGHKENEICDKIAKKEAEKHR